jgi:hypothetical protein
MKKQPREAGLNWMSLTSIGKGGGKGRQSCVSQVIEIWNFQTTKE